MSDPNNPYGQPPGQEPNPYGQPQPEQPQYGQPGQQSDYGQNPYGGGNSGRDVTKRPGTVTAASVVTMIFSGLGLILFAIGTVVTAVARDDIVETIDRELANQEGLQDVSANDFASVLVVGFAIMAIWCLAALVLSVIAMRGKNWARIMVVISASVTALLSLLGILSGVTAITLIAAVAVIVLYFTGGANEWYKAKSTQSTSPQ